MADAMSSSSSSTSRPNQLKTKLFAILLVSGVNLSAAIGADGPPPARVVTETVSEQVISRANQFSGVISFVRVSGVSSEVGGVAMEVPIEAGEFVKKGALLASINTDFAEQDIRITRREMGEVQTQLKKQQNTLKRRKALMATNATSQDAFDDAFFGVQALERQLETLKEQIARKNLEIAKSKVKSPFDGLVLETYVERGEAVAPQTAIAEIASISDVEASASIAQSLLKFQTPGAPVTVKIDALDIQLEGSIKRVAPLVDLRSKNITVKVTVPYVEGMLQNMAVKIGLPTSQQQTLRVLNRDAVVSFQGSEFVYTIVDDKATPVPVNIVSRMGDKVAVDNTNIVAGMTIVVDGNDRLRPQQTVEVIEAQ